MASMKNIFYSVLFLLFLGLSVLPSKGQQLPLINYQLYHPELFNPGYLPRVPLNQTVLGSQARQLAAPGWRKTTQFLNFKGKPIGKSQSLGFGGYLNYDIEHTERRLVLGFTAAAALLNTERSYFHVGINIGLSNWAANYSSYRIYDRTDELTIRPVSLAELDAGGGVSYGFENYAIRAQADAFVSQLPGSLLSRSVPGLKLFPHVFGTGMILFSPFADIYVGPVLNYRNVLTTDPNVGYIGAGAADGGLRIDFDRPGLWIGAGWRLDNSALTAGFGIKITDPDTLDARSQFASFSHLNFGASYPLNESNVFGPNIEISMNFSLGRVGQDGPRIDTIGLMKGAFWVNNGNVNTHRQKRLDPTSPDELVAETFPGARYVDLSYTFNDNQYMYMGDDMEMFTDSTIQKLGADWIGMDNMMENIVTEVVTEGLKPTFDGVEDPDSVEVLKDLLSVRLGSRLKFDVLSAQFGAEGLKYRGELGTDNEFSDTLTIRFDYIIRDEVRDTSVKVVKGGLITNLELAALKLYALNLRMERALLKYYEGKYDFVRVDDGNQATGGKRVDILRPFIIPNNPNQKPFTRTIVEIGFLRDPEWQPEERETGRSSKSSAKNNKKRGRTARQRMKERDRLREEVGVEDD